MFGTKFKQYNPFAILGPPIQPRLLFHCWHKTADVVGDYEICCWCGDVWASSQTVGSTTEEHGKYHPNAVQLPRIRPLDGCSGRNSL